MTEREQTPEPEPEPEPELTLAAVKPYTGPELVYGNFLDGYSFVVFERPWAEKAAEEFTNYLACTTWREALAVSASMTAYWSAVDRSIFEEHADGFETEEEALDAPFDPYRVDEYWPSFPTQVSLATMPEDWPVGEAVDASFDDPHLRIPMDEEDVLLAAAAAAGATLTRDDALIKRLWWE